MTPNYTDQNYTEQEISVFETASTNSSCPTNTDWVGFTKVSVYLFEQLLSKSHVPATTVTDAEYEGTLGSHMNDADDSHAHEEE